MFVPLKDFNNAKFWDKKNLGERGKLTSSPIYGDKIRKIVKIIQKSRGNLLDVGLGTGEIERILDNSRLNLFGIDISPRSVNKAKRYLKGIFKTGSIFRIPFSNDSVDIVLVLDVLEHLPTNKTYEAYSELIRVLKPGGTLIVSVPLNEGLEEMLKHGKNPNGHLRAYTPDILKTELKLSGFKIIRECYLFAFSKLYFLKTFLVNILPFKIRNPNLMIVFAEKR